MSKLSFNDLRSILSCGATEDECLYCKEEDVVIRGSVKEQTFKLPMDVCLIKKLAIFYCQNNRIVLKKTLADIKESTFDSSLIYFKLTEYETYSFKSKYPLEVQMKVLLEDGSILTSEPFKVKVSDTLDNTLFSDNIIQYIALDVDVNGQDIKITQNHNIYTGSESAYLCKLTYDSSWDKFSKEIYFKNDLNYKSVPINGNIGELCVIPKEAILKPGKLYIGIVGYNGDDIKRPTQWSQGIKIEKSCDEEIDSSSSSGGGGTSVPYASEDTPGIMKLYQGSGDNTDGSVSQQKVTDGFRSIKFGVSDKDTECMILNVDF